MKLFVKNILELKGKTLPFEHTYDLPQLTKRNKQLISIGPVHFIGQGVMEAGIFVAKGELSGEYTLACSKCLADLKVEFSQHFEERFNVQAKLLPLTEEEEDEIHEVVGTEIDLLPYIENEVLLSIPFFPACEFEHECRNNLPLEGKDWSLLTEENKSNKIDPRLADLAKFFDKNND